MAEEQPPAVTWEDFWWTQEYWEAEGDKGRGTGNVLAKQSVLYIFCGKGRKGGRQLEGIPINTDKSRREGICLQYGPSLTWHHCMLLPFCLHWQVPLGPGFGHWEVQSHFSAPSAALGGEENKQTRSAGSEQSLLRVPFLLESRARPGEEETGKQSEKLGGESTNPPRATRVEERTFIYGGLRLVNEGMRML